MKPKLKTMVPTIVATALLITPTAPAFAAETAGLDTPGIIRASSHGQTDPLAKTNGRRVIPGEDTDISPLSLPDSDYGAYWGTVQGQPAFFMADGTLFATQAKGVIDVSEWQSAIDWQKVKDAGVDGVIIRLGWGWGNGFDKTALYNISECKRLGIPFGVYVYSYAYDGETGGYEGDNTVSLLQQAGVTPEDLTYPVYYDLERWNDWGGHKVPTSPSVYKQIVDAWYGKLEAAGYTNLGVYSYKAYMDSALNDPSIREKASWVATYGPKLEYEITTPYRGWQYTSSGRIDGINGKVDMSAFGVKGSEYSTDDLQGVTVSIDGHPYAAFNPKTNDYMLEQESGTITVNNVPSGWTATAEPNDHVGGIMVKIASPDNLWTGYYKFTFHKDVPDSDKVDAYMQWATSVADDNTIGYSMDHRQLDPDLDCSSFVYYALKYGARFDMPVNRAFVTGTMEDALQKLGFEKHEYTGEQGLQPGDILLDPAKNGHTEIYMGDGKSIGAHSNRGNWQSGDQDGTEVNEDAMWTGAKEYWRYVPETPAHEYTIEDLKNLTATIDGQPLESFNYKTTDYEISEPGATISMSGLPEGWKMTTRQDAEHNAAIITVTSPDGSVTVDYTFTYKPTPVEPSYSIDDLKGLQVTVNGQPLDGFDYKNTTYTIDSDVADIQLSGIPEGWDHYATDTSTDTETARSITVTSPDGSVQVTYEFKHPNETTEPEPTPGGDDEEPEQPSYSVDDLKDVTVKVNGETFDGFDYKTEEYEFDEQVTSVQFDHVPAGWDQKTDSRTDGDTTTRIVTLTSPDGKVSVSYEFSFTVQQGGVEPGGDDQKPDEGGDQPGGGTENPDTDEPGGDTENPDTDNPDTDNPDTDNPDTENPDTDEPGGDTDNPDGDGNDPSGENPGGDVPDTDEPGGDTESPDVENPDEDNPNEENPDGDGNQDERPDEETPDATTNPDDVTQPTADDQPDNASSNGKNDDLPQTGVPAPAASLGLFTLLAGLVVAVRRLMRRRS